MVLAALLACGDHGYIVEGVVLEVNPPAEIVVDHQEIRGFMGAMTMPFVVRDPALIVGMTPGDQIVARLHIDDAGSWLDAVRVTGHQDLAAFPLAPMPLRPGEWLEPFETDSGAVGRGQDKPTAVGFLFTRCPLPEFCPALVSKLQALQDAVGTDARIVTVTLDPDHDTRAVLDAFGATVGARPDVWHLARAADLTGLAGKAGLTVMRKDGEVLHSSRLLVLDRDGRLIERYDDNRFPVARVAEQLKTGGPAAPPGNSGTLSP